MSRLADITKTVSKKIEREGFSETCRKTRKVLADRRSAKKAARLDPEPIEYFDVMFINGCTYDVPHPIRYRVDHQMEQLVANGMSVVKCDAWNLTLDRVREARSFIIFRCPYTDIIGEFIALAKRLNKKVYFDIDDLVFSRAYTDGLESLRVLSAADRSLYDADVDAMERTLRACGSAITSTEALAKELKKYVPEVFVNRNVASEDMLYYSNRAVYERDILPYLDSSQIGRKELHYYNWARNRSKERKGVAIGYFSGSNTHLDDFKLVVPSLVRVMREYEEVRLVIAGPLELPDAFNELSNRICRLPFSGWEQLPEMIASVDINIAPLEDTLFNAAKSENKWLEAALVKVPTVASNVGAFASSIKQGITGILCENTSESWYSGLTDLLDDCGKRTRIGENAFLHCQESCSTISTGQGLYRYIADKQSTNIMMIMPTLASISGGCFVALKHCCILQDAGYDVTVADDSGVSEFRSVNVEGHYLPLVRSVSLKNRGRRTLMAGHIDKGVATQWETLHFLQRYPYVGRIIYLVQGKEPLFFQPPDAKRLNANATYCNNVEYVSVSRWCKNWLTEEFGKTVRYARNGIDTASFFYTERDFSGRIRILIEGDNSVDYKNIDEAFRIVAPLDRGKYEIWYMSYKGKPKDFYRVDKFLYKVPRQDVAAVYQQCHILLKTSTLESFSYPPLEMMATGGFVIAIPNGGNLEYLIDKNNCLLFDSGNYELAMNEIHEIVSNQKLRNDLLEGGLNTASMREWSLLAREVCELYE